MTLNTPIMSRAYVDYAIKSTNVGGERAMRASKKCLQRLCYVTKIIFGVRAFRKVELSVIYFSPTPISIILM